MAFESFYGGRQGASFVIRKNYDNIADMIAEFSQGGATTGKVNYGEYVLIDTPDKNDRTNGIVYRRGLNYGAAPTTDPKNPGAGAEYIGQIVGPQGDIENLEVGAYNAEAEAPDGGHGEYKQELVPGKTNDSIKYSWINVKDNNGHITKYLIGFQFPYFQQEQVSSKVSAYETGDLIVDITDTDNPFYRKYELKIPKGIKGNSIIDASGIPVVVKKGSQLYNIDGQPIVILQDDLRLPFNEVHYEKGNNYISFEYNSNEVRAKLKDCIEWHSGLYIANYDESAEGSKTQYDGGLFNYVEEMIVSESGLGAPADHLLVYFSDPNHREGLPNPVTYSGKAGYMDLGYVKGKPGTSPVIGNLLSTAELYWPSTNPKTPAQIGGKATSESDPGNSYYDGWVVTIGDPAVDDKKYIYAYDYLATNPNQYCVGYYGDIDGNGGAFVISAVEPELPEGGVWGVAKSVSFY